MAAKKLHYPAVIDKDADSDFGVAFPDFPGCVSAGITLDEAVLGAHEALAGHVAAMVADDQIFAVDSNWREHGKSLVRLRRF